MRATARKATLALAGTALALGALAGCGDDGGGGGGGDAGSSAPDNASTEEFCDAFNSLFTEVMGDVMAEADSADMSQAIPAIKEWAENMQDVGTPDGMPDEAREGFEVFIDAAADIDEDANLEDLQNLGDDLSEADQTAGDAFGDWAAETCPTELPGMDDLPSEIASDLPTEMPTELPSELESLMSDLPTDPSELESMLSELTADAN